MPGLKSTLLGFVGSKFMVRAKVDEVEIVSDRFRLITLTSDKFESVTLQPAAKVRLNAGDWEMRAYTPLSIEAPEGRLRILAFIHGNGPGSRWAASATPGTITHLIGPQRSLDVTGLAQPAVFFGDETSFAAAKTVQSYLAPEQTMRFVFETSSGYEAKAMVERLGLGRAQCYDRQDNDGHLPMVTEAIRHALEASGTSQLILTGSARSIQAIRANLRVNYPGVIKYRVRAYWAPGKTGLE